MRPLKHLAHTHLMSPYMPHTAQNTSNTVKVMRCTWPRPPLPAYARLPTIAELLITNRAVRSAWA